MFRMSTTAQMNVGESLELRTAQILCVQNAAWLQKCMKHFVYSTGSEYLRQLRKVSVSFELLMSLLNLNYYCLSAYQPSHFTAIPNHLTTSFGESWNPQTNTILTARTAQSTELVKRTCQACVRWKCTHPLTIEFCWHLTTVAWIILGAFLSSYIMRSWTVAETKGWLLAKAAAQRANDGWHTHVPLPFDCRKVWWIGSCEKWNSASLCGGNVTLCIPNTASPAGFNRMKATNFHFPVDLSLIQWLPIMLSPRPDRLPVNPTCPTPS